MTDGFEERRGALLGLAYRMLGSRADAEDVVQDAWLRWRSALAEAPVENPPAFLHTVVTRLCLDRLRAAKLRREAYPGPWLPEPVPDADALRPDTAAELAGDVSFALLLVLECLTPAERAAFLLHDVFDRPFKEIAAVLGRSEAACKMLASRARKAVADARGTRRAGKREHERLLAAFAAAVAQGDAEALTDLLTEDAVALTDGGGVRSAALRPVRGAAKVARLFLGLAKKRQAEGGGGAVPPWTLAPVTVNGQPGYALSFGGTLDQVVAIDPYAGRIRAIYVIRNPEKLRGLNAPKGPTPPPPGG